MNHLKRSGTKYSGGARSLQKKGAMETCDSERINYFKKLIIEIAGGREIRAKKRELYRRATISDYLKNS